MNKWQGAIGLVLVLYTGAVYVIFGLTNVHKELDYVKEKEVTLLSRVSTLEESMENNIITIQAKMTELERAMDAKSRQDEQKYGDDARSTHSEEPSSLDEQQDMPRNEAPEQRDELDDEDAVYRTPGSGTPRCPPDPALVAKCEALFPLEEAVVTVCAGANGGAGAAFPIVCRAKGDIVSSSIQSHKNWETAKSSALLRELALGGALLDVGANVGWFTLYTASRGHEVYSVEPMDANFKLLRRSLCLNPAMNVTLFHYGLNEKSQDCEIISNEIINKGNGITVCREPGEALKLGPQQASQGAIQLRRLDALLPKSATIGAVKIDVEGYEAHALSLGGADFLFDGPSPPRKVFSEFGPFAIVEQGRADPVQFLDFFAARGYSMDVQGGLTNEEFSKKHYGDLMDVVFSKDG